jgi:Flp pilus assembly protein TadG
VRNNREKIVRHPKLQPSGIALIEFAAILLLLLTILLGIMEAGRAIMNYHTLYQAVSEGARFASVNGSTSGAPPGPRSSAEVDPLIKQRVIDAAVGLQLTLSNVQVNWTPDNRPGSTVSVSASFLYVPFALGWTNFSLSSFSNVVIQR